MKYWPLDVDLDGKTATIGDDDVRYACRWFEKPSKLTLVFASDGREVACFHRSLPLIDFKAMAEFLSLMDEREQAAISRLTSLAKKAVRAECQRGAPLEVIEREIDLAGRRVKGSKS